MTQDPGPHEALEAIRSARAAFGDRLVYPLGSRLLHATLMAGLVGVFAAPPWLSFWLAAVVAVGVVLLARHDRARTGWRLGIGLSRWAPAIGLALGVALMALIALAMSPALFGGPVWAPPLAVALAWLVAYWAGEAWMRAYRRDVARSGG
jgi:hypothetical protein